MIETPMSKIKTFESFLGDKFFELREVGGMPITKDNWEGMFENWLNNLDGSEILQLGEEYGLYVRQEAVKMFEPTIEMLKQLKEKLHE